MLECLVGRDNLLNQASVDDDIMLSLFSEKCVVSDLTNNQRHTIHTQCMYLCKSYNVAIQHMNKLTWTTCIWLAIQELDDSGISLIKKKDSM